ncbi:MAG: hypothetical protein KGL66_11985 [Alphaproteobacteria bacterium]|nr:hypothetical protein [Alphaproteobacteria bacterium]
MYYTYIFIGLLKDIFNAGDADLPGARYCVEPKVELLRLRQRWTASLGIVPDISNFFAHLGGAMAPEFCQDIR